MISNQILYPLIIIQQLIQNFILYQIIAIAIVIVIVIKVLQKKSAIQSQMILSQGHFYLTHLQNVQIIQVILILVIIQTKIILVKADLHL